MGTSENLLRDVPMGIPPPAHWNCRSILVGMQYPAGKMPDDGQDPYSESLDGWLNRHTGAEQDEMLGTGRAALWRAGAITTRDLLSQRGETLSVAELQQTIQEMREPRDFIASAIGSPRDKQLALPLDRVSDAAAEKVKALGIKEAAHEAAPSLA